MLHTTAVLLPGSLCFRNWAGLRRDGSSLLTQGQWVAQFSPTWPLSFPVTSPHSGVQPEFPTWRLVSKRMKPRGLLRTRLLGSISPLWPHRVGLTHLLAAQVQSRESESTSWCEGLHRGTGGGQYQSCRQFTTVLFLQFCSAYYTCLFCTPSSSMCICVPFSVPAHDTCIRVILGTQHVDWHA